MSTLRRLEIDRLGQFGDGLSGSGRDTVAIAGTLAGETVEARLDGRQGELVAVLAPSPDRQVPPCPQAGDCGGCQLQHMRPDAEDAFKRARLETALKLAGVVHPPLAATRFGGQRRRVAFTARHDHEGTALGFNARRSHRIVAPGGCTVVRPEILGALTVLKAVAAITAKADGTTRLAVLATRTGLDVAVSDARKGALEARQKLMRLALDAGFARLTLDGEIIAQHEPPVLDFGRAPVTLPPSGFAQASLEAELAMADLVLEGIGKAKRVADFFAGSGTFALRIAERAKVHAVEADRSALFALEAGWKAAGGLKPLTTERRDLFKVPPLAKELALYDAVVFDPPRAGAEALSRAIAKSGVRRVVAVSCEPETLARDLAILTQGDYRIDAITPVDQFRHAAHIEAVAVLTSTAQRPKGSRSR